MLSFFAGRVRRGKVVEISIDSMVDPLILLYTISSNHKKDFWFDRDHYCQSAVKLMAKN